MRPAVRAAARAMRPAVQTLHAGRRHGRLTVFGWHAVENSGGALSVDIDTFTRQLDVLHDSGTLVLALDDAVRRLALGQLPAAAVALTFDDGYASVIENAWPLLRERKLPATLFAVSSYLSGQRRFPWDGADSEHSHARIASADELCCAAKDGLDIGSHTVSHRWLPSLEPEELVRELVESREMLEELLGRAVTSVAYPMGGWNVTVRAAAAWAGYTVGVTVDRGANVRSHDRLALRRTIAPSNVADFALVLAGAYTWLRPLDSWRARNGPAW